ncbi:hypothetical protein HEQ60_00375 [Haematospirillum sp. H1815]|uniref:hypothetical protein n=1 Tax=Haematospirillum sp. H1815 TaxID=2723108 RepID=UPI00143BF1A1|nr:hypothetical protein [Haematospirillum sp. H1815]NKD76232.1 hypothetical protein [Haematospirillum sp. H1815]
MDYAVLTGLTVSVAALVIGLFFLLSYLSSLVKSAYQIKVELRSDMEKNLRHIRDELGKQSRLVRTELVKDVSRIRRSLEQDSAVRVDRMEHDLRATTEESIRKHEAAVREHMSIIASRLAQIEDDISRAYKNTARQQAPRKVQRDTTRRPGQDSREAGARAAHMMELLQARQEQAETKATDQTPPLPQPVDLPDFGNPTRQ